MSFCRQSEAREGLGPKAIMCLSLPACLGLCVPTLFSEAGIEQGAGWSCELAGARHAELRDREK